ncbi:MAG: flavodoxin family protein, partial [Okeania sp. SIO3C4]|nr:flavodoxin family protein [Okeania sp. SIO3C4]
GGGGGVGRRSSGGGRIYETGVFQGKRALLSLTTGGAEDIYIKGGFNGDINGILRPIHRGMLQFVGFDVLAPEIVYAPVRMTDEQRVKILENYADRLKEISKESAIDVGIY